MRQEKSRILFRPFLAERPSQITKIESEHAAVPIPSMCLPSRYLFLSMCTSIDVKGILKVSYLLCHKKSRRRPDEKTHYDILRDIEVSYHTIFYDERR